MNPLIFNTYKPKGMGSTDVVRHFKRHLPRPFNKIGHFGTLDPFATGVLMIGINGAQRLNDYVHELMPKTYIATGFLGEAKDTGDETGETTQTIDIPQDIEELLRKNLSEFVGEYWQAPHKYSAAKINGKKMYELAREGVEVSKPKVKRFVHDLEILEVNLPIVRFKATVGSGTYIRSLFEDLAKKCGVVGYLKDLHRDSVGEVKAENALVKDNWPLDKSEEIMSEAIPVYDVLKAPKIILTGRNEHLYSNGNSITYEELEDEGFVWVFASDEKLIGLGKLENSKLSVEFNFPKQA